MDQNITYGQLISVNAQSSSTIKYISQGLIFSKVTANQDHLSDKKIKTGACNLAM